MMNDIDDLLEQRHKIYDVELLDNHWDKLQGKETVGGKKVQIIWEDLGYDFPDTGYLFALPFCQVDEADIFCHITHVNNPDGKDNAEDVWMHLYELMVNENVVRIYII